VEIVPQVSDQAGSGCWCQFWQAQDASGRPIRVPAYIRTVPFEGKTAACFAAVRPAQNHGVYVEASASDRGHPTGRADGAGVTIHPHGINGIEAAAGVVTASTWPMVPTWF